MNNTQTSGKGFGALFVLIAVVVIAAIGLGGYYVWRTYQAKPRPTTTQTTKATEQQTTTTATSTDGIFVKEWGIQIPVVHADDYTYNVVDANTIEINSKTLLSAETSIQCSPATSSVVDPNGGVGLIWRKTSVEPGPAQYSPKVGNYYYALVTGSQAICLDAPGYDMHHDVANEADMAAEDALRTAMANISVM